VIESDIVQRLKSDLILQGFNVDKIADQFTVGIPDLTVSKNKCTVFYEVKYFKMPARFQLQFGTRLRMSPQVTNMCAKQVHAWGAKYLIFFEDWVMAEVEPMFVKKSILERVPVTIFFQEYKQWLENLASSYYR
jgi:hypothetical protein